jgi:hypothetical protein
LARGHLTVGTALASGAAQEVRHVLLFELFPAFVMVVSAVVGIWLFIADRNSRGETARNSANDAEGSSSGGAGRAGSSDRARSGETRIGAHAVQGATQGSDTPGTRRAAAVAAVRSLPPGLAFADHGHADC